MIRYCLILGLCFFSPLNAFAEIGSSSAEASSDVNQNTSEFWLNKTRIEPSSLTYFNLGVAYYREEKLDLALGAFKKVVAAKSPLEPVARYYSAIIYSKRGKNDSAKIQLAPISIQDLPPNLKNEILHFKNTLYAEDLIVDIAADEETEEEDVAEYLVNTFASIDLSYGTNSNPLFYPKSSTTSSDTDNQTLGKFRLGTDLIQYASTQLSLDYFYYGSAYTKTGDANFDYHNVTIPLSYRGEKWSFKIYPEFYRDRYANVAYSEQAGTGLELGLQLNPYYWGLTFQSLSIKNQTQNYSYLSGNANKYSLFLDKKMSSGRLYSGLGLSTYSYQDTSSLASSYNALSLFLSYTFYWGKFDFSIAGSSEIKTYAKLASDTTNRQDNRKNLTLNLGYYPNRKLKIYLEQNQSQSESTFTSTSIDYDYTQSVSSIGLKYYFN